ncbi:arginine decarboxylase, pyruvoyl-dependent [Patescibacteria group bacterium]|nr:MAG: arginine decarboxylase, pyruvoyl-dependent [Patescibacteria group bacterium]
MSTQNKLLPKYAFFIAGTGKHKDRLQAFDRALLAAGPVAHNLVSVSSILPAECKIIPAGKGFRLLTPGQITFCVMARQDTNQKRRIVSAAVGVAKTKASKEFGYISEYHGNASSKYTAEGAAKRLAVEMLAKKLAIPPSQLNLKFTKAVAASIKQPGDDKWVCALALCVFVT